MDERQQAYASLPHTSVTLMSRRNVRFTGVCRRRVLNGLYLGQNRTALYVQVTVHRDKLRINNQIDASSFENLFCHETLHVSGIFCAHHQELPVVHVAIGMFHAGYVAAS
jgi:hypothetical protein